MRKFETSYMESKKMRLKIFSLPYDKQKKSFSEEVVNAFISETEVTDCKTTFFIHENEPVWSVLITYEEGSSKRKKDSDALSEEDSRIYNRLKEWRAKKASEAGVPIFIIFKNETLLEITRKKPVSQEELRSIRGMSDNKLKNYGQELTGMFRKEAVFE